MPLDRSDLATPTLMRAARGTYASSIRAHLQAIGAEDLPRNGAFILFRLLRGQRAPRRSARRPGREQAGREPGDRRPGEPGLRGPQPGPVRPPTHHPRADRARARGGGRRLARHRGDRQPARGPGVARGGGGDAVRVDGAGRHQGGGDGLRRRRPPPLPAHPAIPAVQPDLPGPGPGGRAGATTRHSDARPSPTRAAATTGSPTATG